MRGDGWGRRLALDLSLKYGAGDLGWFDNLSPEKQAEVLALEQLRAQEATA